MSVIQYFRQMFVLIFRRMIRFAVRKSLWLLIAAVFIYAIIVTIWSSEEQTTLFEDAAEQVLNKTRKSIPETKNPPIVWWNAGYRLIDETIECAENIKCDAFSMDHKLRPNSDGAYLFYASRLNFTDLPLPRYHEKIIWALTHEESPRTVVEFLHETGLNLFNISSTFSRYSDVPFPLQYLESLETITSKKHFVTTPEKNKLSDTIAPIIFMSSSCYTFSDRENYVKELMKYIPIDSYGECLNNKKWPTGFPEDHLNNLDNAAILDFVARYKFAIAIENGVCEDYITEKFWRPINLGVVPIYFGSPSIQDWFPNNKSAILIQDFANPKLLSEHLFELMRNDVLYEEYLEHKTEALISNKRLYNEMVSRPYQTDVLKTSIQFECFVCKKLHENNRKPGSNIVTKRHYNCSKPTSALTKQPIQSEMAVWEYAKVNAERLYERVRSTT